MIDSLSLQLVIYNIFIIKYILVMIKKLFFIAFICALTSCQQETVQFDTQQATSHELSASSDYEDLPSKVRDIIANGGVGHFGCQTTSKKGVKGGGELGNYAYPYTSDIRPIRLYASSLPCQSNIPYFIFSNIDGVSTTFRLVLNPSYFDPINVVDVNWELNGEDNPSAVQTLTINDLKMGESSSVTCTVFSSDNNLSVYSQEMTFDFQISRNLEAGLVAEFTSGYTYTCSRGGGGIQIVAP